MTGIQSYFSAFSTLSRREESSPEMRYLRFLVEEFVKTRNARVIDLDSREMNEARSMMDRVFSLPTDIIFPCLCIDGRVLSETVYSLPNRAFRTPAADISDALSTADGRLYLVEGDFTQNIRERMKKNGRITVVLDSHSHCAAKSEEVKSAFGVAASDNGLFDDVRRKKLISKALFEFAEQTFGAAKMSAVSVIQTTFDVHSGFLFMGLEQDAVLSDKRVLRGGMTESVLEALAREKKILSTALFVEEGGILFEICRKLKQSVGTIDFEKDYSGSMLRFWKGLAEISSEALPLVQQEVRRIFPDIFKESEEFRVRSVFLLSNAALGFLLNAGGSYPYKDHRETVVVVTNQARGPYEAAAPFPVNEYKNGGRTMLSFVAGFAASIVRGNRSKGSFPKGERAIIERCFRENEDAFIKSPVPVFISERVSGDISEDVALSFSALVVKRETSLEDMTSEGCCRFLRENIPNVPDTVIEGVERLRTRAIDLYRPGLSATGNFLSGQLALIPALRMENGKIVAIFPFLLSGYSEKYLRNIEKMK